MLIDRHTYSADVLYTAELQLSITADIHIYGWKCSEPRLPYRCHIQRDLISCFDSSLSYLASHPCLPRISW